MFMPATFVVSMPRVRRSFAYPLGFVTVPSNLLAASPAPARKEPAPVRIFLRKTVWPDLTSVFGQRERVLR